MAPGVAATETRAQAFDIRLEPGDAPVGEVVAAVNLGPVALALHHSEFLAFLNPAQQDEPDSLQRLSRLEAGGSFDIGGGVALPAGFDVSLGAWSSGRYDLELGAHGGFRLSGVAFDHSLTFATGLGAGDSQMVQGNGQMALIFDRFGGAQEAVLEYEALPLARATALHLNSDWQLNGGSTVTLGLSHRVAEGLSEARFGLGQEVGIFDMTADFGADSTGTYGIGISFALRFGAPSKDAPWSLATLLAGVPPR